MHTFQMYLPTRLLFGPGMLAQLHAQIMPGKRAMVVISKGKAVRTNGALDRTLQELHTAHVETFVFDQISANPTRETVMGGVLFAKTHQCDFVVALGGGSVMDAGKIIAMMVRQSGDLWEYALGGTGGGKAVTEPPLPVICITTTAGTGSEVDSCGVISNPETREKLCCGCVDSLYPVLAIVDPELMLSVPPDFTAYQGFDALFHAVECYLSKLSNPLSDIFALEAMTHIASYLARAVADGKDLEARTHVAYGNTLGGHVMCLSDCTSEHPLEHAMSAFHPDLPHGAGLLMIAPTYYRRLIEKRACPERFIQMARAMGAEGNVQPETFLFLLEGLMDQCNVLHLRMSDYGIRPEEFEAMADNALDAVGGAFESDPIPLSRTECIQLYQTSYQ